MHLSMMRCLVYLGILVSTVPESLAQQSPDDCLEYDRVIYRNAPELRLDRGDGTVSEVTLHPLPPDTQPSVNLQTLEKQRSPQGTVFFVQTVDTRRVNTSLHIFGNRARPLALRIDITNHIYDVRSRWINEKLLSLRVWLGRIASWDLILDIETRRFVYAEGANYGSSILSCSEKMQLQEGRK